MEQPFGVAGVSGDSDGTQKANQFLAVNSWKRRIAVSAVVLAMTAVLASQTTKRPNRNTKELTSGPIPGAHEE